MKGGGHGKLGPFFGGPGLYHPDYRYLNKIKQISGSNLVLYLAQNEFTGTVATDYSGSARNGIYNGATLAQIAGPGPSMGLAPLYDGINDNVTFSAPVLTSLNAAWNPDELTLLIWLKMIDVAHWNDASDPVIFVLAINPSNFYQFYKTAPNTLSFQYARGGVNQSISKNFITSLDWLFFAGTVSKSQNIIRYFSGAGQVGADQACGGVWAGLPLSFCTIGSSAGSNFFAGYLSAVALLNRALTPAEVATVSVPQ